MGHIQTVNSAQQRDPANSQPTPAKHKTQWHLTGNGGGGRRQTKSVYKGFLVIDDAQKQTQMNSPIWKYLHLYLTTKTQMNPSLNILRAKNFINKPSRKS